MVSGLLPLVFLAAYAGLCLLAVLTNQHLLKAFATQRPDLVRKHLPECATRGRHPNKLFFFLKPSTAKILAAEPQLLQLRNRLVWLVWCLAIYLMVLAGLLVLAAVVKP
jgi:hypothetical protein